MIEKNSQAKVEEFNTRNGPEMYTMPGFFSGDADRADSISVLYDESVLIRHYRDTVKRAAKSYNRDSNRSLFKKDSYIRTTSKNPDADSDKVVDAQLLYTFTEDDYLFAK